MRPLPDNRLDAPLADPVEAVAPGWRPLVSAWAGSEAGRATRAALESRLAAGATVYPQAPLTALAMTPPEAVRVVIVGQDPYHGPGQAEGLAFSVPAGVPLPPSLRNIAQELARDLGLPTPTGGSLRGWARQGVLLLNTSLTVEEGRPASHAKIGWRALTDAVFQSCWFDRRPKAFLLWGAHAQGLLPADGTPDHLVLRANHPSPLSARRPPVPFIGCGHFGTVNRWLSAQGERPIDWRMAA